MTNNPDYRTQEELAELADNHFPAETREVFSERRGIETDPVEPGGERLRTELGAHGYAHLCEKMSNLRYEGVQQQIAGEILRSLVEAYEVRDSDDGGVLARKIPLRELGLSSSAHVALHCMGVETAGDLESISVKEFRSYRSVGPMKVQDVYDRIDELGLQRPE